MFCPRAHRITSVFKDNYLKISFKNWSNSSQNENQARMLAWQIHSYGGLEELVLSDNVRIPPLTSPENVLVKVSASSVNPIDIAMMGGYGATTLNLVRRMKNCSADVIEFPLILGRDFTGEIIERGHGVKDELQVGDKIWGVISPFESGCHAQYAVVPASNVNKKPSNLNDIEAASILYAAVTAWSSLKITGDLCFQSAKGKKVLVLGGSGGVGSSAIQMLKAWGSQVVSTCNTDAIPLVESFGVDKVIDYTDPNADMLIKDEGKYDIIFNAAGLKIPQYLQELKEVGFAKYITVTSPLLLNADRHGFIPGMAKSLFDLFSSNILLRKPPLFLGGPSVRWGFFIPFSKAIEEITDLTEAGKLTPAVDKAFKFSELPAAYQKVLSGHSRGKTVINVKDS